MTNIVFWLGLALSIISGAYKYLINDGNINTPSEKQEIKNDN